MANRTVSPRAPELSGYLRAIERYPILSPRRERELARRARAGDRRAADLLACCTLRSVYGLALRLRGYGLPLSDLVAEGNLGLLEAIARFDPERGVRLWTYARHDVRSRMLAFVRRNWSVVSLPGGALNNRLFFSLPRERARLRALQGEGSQDAAETTDRLARRFGTSPARVQAMESRVEHRDASLSRPAPGGVVPAVEAIAGVQPDAESVVADASVRCWVAGSVHGALSGLDARERFIAQRRWLDEDCSSLAELGQQLGVSRERVRQLEARACGKLRESLAAVAAA